MALDEALLEAMPRLGQPVLRFYAWTEPAASFGYFQKYEQVERMTSSRPLVRRPTGGGLVPHAADWTYSVCFPASHEWWKLRAVESYRRVHEWIQAALAALGTTSNLAAASQKAAPGQCFSGYEISDVLWRGNKIAGAAQRRNRLGLLIQGSIQPRELRITRPAWQEAMLKVCGERKHAGWLKFEPDTELRERAEVLAANKYSLEEHTRRK